MRHGTIAHAHVELGAQKKKVQGRTSTCDCPVTFGFFAPHCHGTESRCHHRWISLGSRIGSLRDVLSEEGLKRRAELSGDMQGGSWTLVAGDLGYLGCAFQHPTPAHLHGLSFDHQFPSQPQASDGSDDWSMLLGGACNPPPATDCNADVRGVIIQEMNAFPCWIEARKDLLSPGLQRVLERFLNAILECHYEMFHVVPDAVFSTIANRVAEACLRCQFRRATNSPVIASATPPGTSPRTRRPLSSAQALGFGPPHDPNLDPNLLRAPPITDPPSMALPLWASMQRRLLVGPLMGMMMMKRAGIWAIDSCDWHWGTCCCTWMDRAASCNIASAELCGVQELCSLWS